jgi:hypothetical protein
MEIADPSGFAQLEPESEPEATPADNEWDSAFRELGRRFPGNSDGVLFCIYKLQGNPELSLRDFRDEARLHGIAMSGRSLHSARVLLGLTKAAQPRRPRRDAEEVDEGGADADLAGDTLESQLREVVDRIQASAREENERLRAAIREAIALLQRALE